MPENLAEKPIRFEYQDEVVTFSLEHAHGMPVATGDTVTFEDALPHIDISYRADSTGVEELLTLETPEADNAVRFDLQMSPGLTLEEDHSGNLHFSDGEDAPLAFAPPVMYDDSASERGFSTNVDLRTAGQETLILAADPEWLGSPSREYPVVVDPTLVVEAEPDVDSDDALEVTRDCWIGEGPQEISEKPHCRESILKTGFTETRGGERRRSLLRFPIGAVPAEASISSAKLSLRVAESNNRNTLQVALHRVTESWGTKADWKVRKYLTDWTSQGGTFSTTENAVVAVDGDTSVVEEWAITGLVKNWHDGTHTNNGLILKTDRSTNNVVSYVASEGTDSKEPKLTITYTSLLDFGVTTRTGHSVSLAWAPNKAPAGTTQFELYRKENFKAPDGSEIPDSYRKIDVVLADVSTYTDYLLWFGESYTYELRAINDAGSALKSEFLTVSTLNTNDLPRLYSDSSFWNERIPASPILEPKTVSDAMIGASFTRWKDGGTLQRPQHSGPSTISEPNLAATESFGAAVAYANPSSPSYTFTCTNSGSCEYANGNTSPGTFRIPFYAVANEGSDGKLYILNPTTNNVNPDLNEVMNEFDITQAGPRPPSTSQTWQSYGRWLTSSTGRGSPCPPGYRWPPNADRTIDGWVGPQTGIRYKCTGTSAAGFPGLAGALRPEELTGTDPIDHALFITSPYTTFPVHRLSGKSYGW